MRAASVGWPMARKRSARRYSECRSISNDWVMPGQRRTGPRPFPTGLAGAGGIPAAGGLPLFVPFRRLDRPAAFWSVAVLLVLMLAASGVPSPLYRVYQEEFGFSSGVLTTIFGIYALALLVSLLVVGGLSDHIGRRPVLVVAFLLEAAAMVLFLVSDGVGWLLAARIVQGLATGALTSTLGASVLDLQNRERPLGALINSAAPGLGLSLGAVGAGLLVQFVPSPTDWVFAVLTAVFVLASAGTWLLLPETSARLPGARGLAAPAGPRAAGQPAAVPGGAAHPGRLLGGGRPLRLAGPVAAGGRVRHPEPPRRRAADLRPERNRRARVTGAARSAPERSLVVGALVFAVGVAGTVASLFAGR